LEKITHEDDLQSTKGTTISPDHLDDSIDHIDRIGREHRDLIDDEDFRLDDIFVQAFFLLEQLHIMIREVIFDTDP